MSRRRGPVGGESSSAGSAVSRPVSDRSATAGLPELHQTQRHHGDHHRSEAQRQRSPSGPFDPGQVEPQRQRQQNADRIGAELDESVPFVAYSVGILLPLPLGFYLARIERTRWGSLSLCFTAVVVAVMTLRLMQLWQAGSG